MLKFKPLVWMLSEDGSYCWAKSPAGSQGQLSIGFEEGRWWSLWDFALDTETGDLDALKVHAQRFHENHLMQFLEKA